MRTCGSTPTCACGCARKLLATYLSASHFALRGPSVWQELLEAAYALFDSKLDSIGSGMANVRQVISLLRFGYTEALGKPVELSKDLFQNATLSRRRMADVYDDPESLPSPRRWLRSPRSPTGRPLTTSRTSLEPLSVSSRPGASRASRERPVTQANILRMSLEQQLLADQQRPSTQGSGRGRSAGPHLAQLSTEDEFGPTPMRAPNGDYESDYDSDDEPEIEHFTPWGQVDAVARETAAPARKGLMTERGGLNASASLPALSRSAPQMSAAPPPAVSASGVVRVIQARIFRRMPWEAKLMLERVDDGNHRASASALMEELRNVAENGRFPCTIPEEGLVKVVAAFDHLDNGSIDLKEFIKSIGTGRLPSPSARQRAREPPPPKVVRKRRRKKPSEAEAAAAAPEAAEPPKPRRMSLLDEIKAAAAEHNKGGFGAMKAQMNRAQAAKLRVQQEIEAAAEKALLLQRKSARAAALLIASIKEKCADDGECTRVEFTEGMYELGIIPSLDAPTEELFATMDIDGSGVINMTELEEALSKELAPQAIDHLKELLAKNSSVKTSVIEMREKLHENAARVIDLFKKWDNDGDGQISKKEFVKAMPMFGMEHCLPVELSALFDAFDPDGSGEISFRELNRMLRRDKEGPKKVEMKKEVKRTGPEVVEVPQLREEVKAQVEKYSSTVVVEEMPAKSKMELMLERKACGLPVDDADLEEDDDDDSWQNEFLPPKEVEEEKSMWNS